MRVFDAKGDALYAHEHICECTDALTESAVTDEYRMQFVMALYKAVANSCGTRCRNVFRFTCKKPRMSASRKRKADDPHDWQHTVHFEACYDPHCFWLVREFKDVVRETALVWTPLCRPAVSRWIPMWRYVVVCLVSVTPRPFSWSQILKHALMRERSRTLVPGARECDLLDEFARLDDAAREAFPLLRVIHDVRCTLRRTLPYPRYALDGEYGSDLNREWSRSTEQAFVNIVAHAKKRPCVAVFGALERQMLASKRRCLMFAAVRLAILARRAITRCYAPGGTLARVAVERCNEHAAAMRAA